MKSLIIATALIAAYIVAQAAFSGYHIRKGRELAKTTYAGVTEYGDKSKPEFKLFMAGDSLAAGVGASNANKSLAGLVAQSFPGKHVTFTNFAVSGSRMKDITASPKEKQDLTVLVISSNDLTHLTSQKEFERQTEEALNLYTSKSKRVILVGPADIGGTTLIPLAMKPVYKLQRPKYASIMKKTASKYENVTFANPADFSKKPYGHTEAADGFHPNDSGHRYWADVIISAIRS